MKGLMVSLRVPPVCLAAVTRRARLETAPLPSPRLAQSSILGAAVAPRLCHRRCPLGRPIWAGNPMCDVN